MFSFICHGAALGKGDITRQDGMLVERLVSVEKNKQIIITTTKVLNTKAIKTLGW